MRRIQVLLLAFTVPISAASANSPAPSQAVAEPFAPQLWGQDEEVHGGTFTGDGRTFYFFKKLGPEDFRIVVSTLRDGAWTAPERVPFSTTQSDLYPAVSPDGNRIVFTSYRQLPGNTSARRNAHLWMTERRANGWTEPTFLHEISTPGSYHPGVKMLTDGTLYFRVIDAQSRATFRARLVGPRYPTRERVSEVDALQTGTTRVWGAEPSPDGRLFFLTMAQLTQAPSSFGPADIFVVKVENGHWSRPSALPASVNTDANEAAVSVNPVSRQLVFTRDGRMYQIPLRDIGLEQ
jgi:hypothetical protein